MKDDESAFPCIDKHGYQWEGMSLRDYFAGQALVGIITSDCSHRMAVEPRAELAYRIADAMIAERENEVKNGL
jgi:hypothetical protein